MTTTTRFIWNGSRPWIHLLWRTWARSPLEVRVQTTLQTFTESTSGTSSGSRTMWMGGMTRKPRTRSRFGTRTIPTRLSHFMGRWEQKRIPDRSNGQNLTLTVGDRINGLLELLYPLLTFILGTLGFDMLNILRKNWPWLNHKYYESIVVLTAQIKEL